MTVKERVRARPPEKRASGAEKKHGQEAGKMVPEFRTECTECIGCGRCACYSARV